MSLVINGRSLTRRVTGVERYASMLLQVIAKEWPDTRILIPSCSDLRADPFGLEVVRTGRTRGHMWEQLELPSALRPEDVLLSPANSGPLRVRRQVLAVHDLAVIHHPEWFDQRYAYWYGFLYPRLIRRVAKVITVSKASASDLRRTFALQDDQVELVQPWVPEIRLSERSIKEPMYCLVVASRDPRKGVETILSWYRDRDGAPMDLVLVGGRGPFAADDLSGIPGVRYMQDLSDAQLSELYLGAFALIQASTFEGFGLPILEAFQHGCPVIASDIEVFREVFGAAPVYVDPRDGNSIENALQRLSEGGYRSDRIAAGHREAARFSEERTREQLHAVLDTLLHP